MKKVLSYLVVNFYRQTNPFSLFKATKASPYSFISLMIYGRIIKEEISFDLFTGVFCPDVQPGKERREDV
jgi:hypothetical protein